MTTGVNRKVPRAAEVLDMRSILNARISSDGTRVVYAVSAISEDRSEDRAQLCVVDVASAESRQLTPADALDTAPAWLPDGSGVVFHSTRSSTPQIHRVDVVTEEVTQLSDHPFGVGKLGPAVCPAGTEVALWAPTQAPADRSLPYRVTDGFWRFDGLGRLDQAVMELFVMPATGGPARQLTENGAVPVGAHWSPDGKQILHLGFRAGDAPTYQLRLHDLAAGTDTLIWEPEFHAFPPAVAWLPGGRIVRSTPNLVVSHGEPLDLVVTDAQAEAPAELRTAGVEGWIGSLLPGDFPFSLQTPQIVVAPDGRSVFGSVQKGGRVELWSIPTEGPEEPRRIVAGDQTSIALDVTDETVLLAVTTMHEPIDLWAVNHDGSDLRRLTNLNAAAFGPDRHFTVRRLDALGEDGAEVEAWFLVPRGAQGPVPTVLTNHGGPHASWGHIFSYDFAMLAAAGYGTLLVNGRGSTGYAPEFAQRIHGDLGNLDISDIERALDLAIAELLADPNALGVRGASNGGYLTGWMVTHSDRFKAAVIENGMLDLNAAIGADIGYIVFPGWMTGGPLEREAAPKDRFELSPTTFAERCTTPTLVIQHEQDLRCPSTNGDLLYALLKFAGRTTTEMLRLPTTSHSGSRTLGSPAARVAENEALLDWFERYLPG